MEWRRGQAYSQHLRKRVLAADHLSARAAAELFSVSVSYVVKARQRRDRTGELTVRSRRRPTVLLLAGLDGAILSEVDRRPSATLADLRAWLLGEQGISVSTGTMWNTLRRLGLTLKKSPSGQRSRHVRISPRHARPGVSFSPA